MTKLSGYAAIFYPSAISLTLSIIVACLTIMVDTLHYFLGYYGVNGGFKVGADALDNVNKGLNSVFGASGTDTLITVLFWASVGLVVYVIVEAVIKDAGQIFEAVEERHKFVWPKNVHPKFAEKVFERILYRIALFFILLLYIIRVISFFFRGKISSIDIFGQRLSHQLANHAGVNAVVFVLSEIIVLHVAVILLRLFFIRGRLFS